MSNNSPQAILDFWFGGSEAQKMARWWGKDASVDATIKSNYAALTEEAFRDELQDWMSHPESYLALILLLDQFPRNMYRDTPKAFSYDSKALSLALKGIECGVDQSLNVFQCTFFYLPLEHAEDAVIQAQCVALFEKMLAQAPASQKTACQNFLDYAVRHQKIIDQFGRFPHRNQILGRASSKEEENFLKQPNSGF